jgi:hypothetical protein
MLFVDGKQSSPGLSQTEIQPHKAVSSCQNSRLLKVPEMQASEPPMQTFAGSWNSVHYMFRRRVCHCVQYLKCYPTPSIPLQYTLSIDSTTPNGSCDCHASTITLAPFDPDFRIYFIDTKRQRQSNHYWSHNQRDGLTLSFKSNLSPLINSHFQLQWHVQLPAKRAFQKPLSQIGQRRTQREGATRDPLNR